MVAKQTPCGILMVAALTISGSVFATAPEQTDKADSGQSSFYGQAPWASVHRDSRNSDFSPLVTSTKLTASWSVLDGAALINPGVVNSNGTHYISSGRGPGYSHLHAFSADGELLWETPVQKSDKDFDALSGFNAPVIDPSGDIYIGDGNQFWAFHPDGKLKWVSPLPEPGKPFVYQVISKQGYVGGITVGGMVLFYRPDDGALAVPAFQLPQGISPAKGPSLPGLWGGGLFHESVIELFKQIAFGYAVQVANAPAVHPTTGRIFITAAGPMEGDKLTGVLYGLDVTSSGIKVAFATRMGGGSGTSPALSVDGNYVYSADGEGQMLAVDTSTGEVVWAAKGEGLLSPAIGDDGTILTGDIFASPTVVALSPKDGSRVWAKSYDDYAASRLPELQPRPPSFPSGKPVARLVSVISASANSVWVGMNLGYDYHQPGSGLTLPVPHKTVVCAVRPIDGELLDCVDVRDTVEGMINIGTAGRLSVSHTSIFGSFFYYGLNPTLPKEYRSPMKPIGGLTAFRPVSFCQQAQLEAIQIIQLLAKLKANLNNTDVHASTLLAKRVNIQLGTMNDTAQFAQRENELDAARSDQLQKRNQWQLKKIRELIDDLARKDANSKSILRKHAVLFVDSSEELACLE